MNAQRSPHTIWIRNACDRPQEIEQRLATTLARQGIELVPCSDAPSESAGIFVFDRITPDVLESLRDCSRNGFGRVIALTPRRELLQGNTPWSILRVGAADLLLFDHQTDPSATIAARLSRWNDVDRLVDSTFVRTNLVGRSRAWVATLRNVAEIAFYTGSSVLLSGESGTGKELLARMIHTLDSRGRKQEFVLVDCTTIVPELSGSEFFGHERGAFTGAINERDGALALANGGTLFLDELGELPMRLQAELLRAIQERAYKRVGGNIWKQSSFRLVCATHRDLLHEIEQGRFRRDFYYRIATWTCRLPTLRERIEDIIPLAEHFLSELFSNRPIPPFDEPVRRFLLTREYPGNVRDLKQLVTRIAGRYTGSGPITLGDIPEEDYPRSDEEHVDGNPHSHATLEDAVRRALLLGAGAKEIGRAATETAIDIVLDEEGGNLQRAARRLGLTDRALQMRRATRRPQLSEENGWS